VVTRVRTPRPEVLQFVSWQRWTPPQTAPLVRLIRVLAH
jgi:hypothetical protein